MADLSNLSDDQLLSALGPAPKAAGTPAAFIAQHQGTAQAAGQKLGVDPDLLLAQWGLETGWGKSVVPGTNNLGNIKDFSGGGLAARDNMTGSTDNYRAYSSPDAFAADQASLLARKYPGVVGAGSDVQKFAGGLRGYAEDPNYGAKLASVVQTVQRNQSKQPGVLARVGDAVASAISGTANAATPQDLSGISDDDLLAALGSRNNASIQSQTQSQQGSPGGARANPPILDSVGHQLGLTARAAGHGIADAVGLVANPVNALINTVGDAIGHNPHLQDVDTLIRRGVDAVTPAPANATEQTVGDIAGAMANPVNMAAGPIMAGTRGVASAALRGAVAGGATAGAQPLHGDDTIGTELSRVGGGALGGAAGGAIGATAGAALDKLVNGANRVVTAIKSATPGVQRTANTNADELLVEVARQEGIDLAAIPESIRNGVRAQVADALASNKTTDAASILRRAEGEAVLGRDAGLTLGQSTRDPIQFAQERNFRGVQGAGEPLTQRFADQNRALIGALNERGAANAPGEFNAGQSTINALQGVDDAARANVTGLYNRARSLNGGDIPLDHTTFVNQANTTLDQDLAHAHLPEWARTTMNQISSGDLPLTVGVSEQFKTQLSRAIRSSTDGNQRHALGVVRNALESAEPLQGSTQFGGNQIVPHGAPLPPSNPGEEAVQAFGQARAAAAQRFGTIDSNPALRAVVNGDAVPDNFFKRYVVNGNVGDVNSLLRLVPDQGNQLRAQMADYLKSKALNGASDEIGTFSQAGFNKALNSIGDAKLQAIFGSDVAAQLRQIGRVAGNIQAQPAGSAVNNSNTGAAVMNLLSKMSGKVGGFPGVNIVRNSVNQFLDERTVANSLAAQIRATANPGVKGSLNPLLPLLAPAGGALVAQPGHQR
ncbi:glucosaminidase domain-containing protein [Caballeronia sp. EK]|uniref:glycoside hydrolase family 73 protein n=1 Tax=Caballeronia sp. EK TaxID=2767469 RepID=UPI001654CDDE|nr:glucosaminidase domain-containing protein [Caballeronia sp. EK]MBC8642137.1 glucosaminidase domain-containing protein [Caballeronia sp. EK]